MTGFNLKNIPKMDIILSLIRNRSELSTRWSNKGVALEFRSCVIVSLTGLFLHVEKDVVCAYTSLSIHGVVVAAAYGDSRRKVKVQGIKNPREESET